MILLSTFVWLRTQLENRKKQLRFMVRHSNNSMPVLPTFTFFSEIEREIVPTIPITTQTYLYEEYHTQVTYQPNKEETQRKHINKRYEKICFLPKKKIGTKK